MSSRLGKYELISRIARGGMAETFRARVEGAAGVTKQVVIKKVLPELSKDPDFIAAFIDEAKLSSALSHGNIAQVFEFGRFDDDYFLAMEWVDGKSLAEIFERMHEKQLAFFPPSIACFVAIEALKALHYAHTRAGEDGKPLNLVHRDVSADNVLVGFEGQVKVIDFGLAKAVLRGQRPTEPGLVKGKYTYFSPEQASALPVDARSDVFSLGVLLYRMLCGTLPFSGEMHVVIHAIQNAHFPPVQQVNALVPARLAEVVARSMTRAPDDRYATALEMQQALTQLLYREDPAFSSETVRDWLARLFKEGSAPRKVAKSREVQALPSAPVAVSAPPVHPESTSPVHPESTSPVHPERSRGTEPVPLDLGRKLQTFALAALAGVVLLGVLTVIAMNVDSGAAPVPRPAERPPALAGPPPSRPAAAVVATSDTFVYPATVVVRAPRHRLKLEGVALPEVKFAAKTRAQLVERGASDEDSPLFLLAGSEDPAKDGSIRLVLQRPVATPDVTGGRLFDFQPFDVPARVARRTVEVGEPATALSFDAVEALVGPRQATWLTVENLPADEKVRLILRAVEPTAWSGRPRPASVLVVWKRAFGRLLPPPGGDWPDEVDRAVLTEGRPLVLEHATVLAFVFADPLAVDEKDSALVEVFGTGEPSSKPDPEELAKAMKRALAAPKKERAATPKTIDLGLFDEALSLVQQGKLPQARTKLDECVASTPDDFECHKLRGAVLDRLGDSKRAVLAYREYLKRAPAGDPGVPKVEALIQLHAEKP